MEVHVTGVVTRRVTVPCTDGRFLFFFNNNAEHRTRTQAHPNAGPPAGRTRHKAGAVRDTVWRALRAARVSPTDSPFVFLPASGPGFGRWGFCVNEEEEEEEAAADFC